MTLSPTSADFFETMYQKREDPWQFASSQYECDRYLVTLRALGKRRFRRAFEPGCSIGVLTAQLADICDCLDAIEISPTAVARAQARCNNLPNVQIRCGALPDDVPPGEFDLLVFSEIGYYFSETRLRSVAINLVNRLETGGTFLAVHWLGNSSDHVLGGDQVHDVLETVDGLRHTHSERHSEFRLDRWSVA